jgi:predicted GH43/DUF377 family glycosyl hydrolase
VEDRRGLSHLCERPQNGVDGWQIDKEPTLMSSTKKYPEEIWGIEDSRITFVPELQQDTWSPTPLISVAPRMNVSLDL